MTKKDIKILTLKLNSLLKTSDIIKKIMKLWKLWNSKTQIKTLRICVNHDPNSVETFASANGTINHTGDCMCHILEQHILFISTWHEIPLSHRPYFLFCSRNISRQPCKTMSHNYPEQKALWHWQMYFLLSRRHYVLTSELNTSYLSQPRRGREKSKRENEGRVIKTDRERGGRKPWAMETLRDVPWQPEQEDSEPFRPMFLLETSHAKWGIAQWEGAAA